MPSTPLLRLEQSIARAHQHVWAAYNLADSMNMHGAAHDLDQIRWELQRVQEAILKGSAGTRRLRDA